MGQTKTLVSTLINQTGEKVSVTNCSIAGSTAFQWSCPSSIGVGQSVSLSVTFAAPKAAQTTTHSATLTIEWSTPNHSGELVITLKGKAVAQPTYLYASPSEIDFMNVSVGDSKTEKTIIYLGGDGQTAVSSVYVVGAAEFTVSSTDCEGKVLISTGINNCYVKVKFSPKAPGTYKGTLKVVASIQTLDIPLEGSSSKSCTDDCSSDACESATVLKKCKIGSDGCYHWVNESCPSWTKCDFQSAQCVPCGSEGQPCCASLTCQSGLSCQSGTCIKANPCANLSWNPGLTATSPQPGLVTLSWSAEPVQFDQCVDSYAILRFVGGPPPPGGFSTPCTPTTDASCRACLATGTSCQDSAVTSGEQYFYALYPVKGGQLVGSVMGSPVIVIVK